MADSPQVKDEIHTPVAEPPPDPQSETAQDPAVAPRREDVSWVLGLETSLRPRWAWKKWLLAGLAAAAALLLLFVAFRGGGEATEFRTATVERGSLTILVTATGALEPTNEVEVGSELSGIIESIFVDYNSAGRAGEPLARLDTSKLEAQAQQLRAGGDRARAGVGGRGHT